MLKEVKAHKLVCEHCTKQYTDPETGQQLFEYWHKAYYPAGEQGWFLDQFHTFCPECDKDMIEVELSLVLVKDNEDSEHMSFYTKDLSIENAKYTVFKLLIKQIPEGLMSNVKAFYTRAKIINQ